MDMANAVQEARRLGQSIWYDNIRRGLIGSGELQRLIDLGVSGVTSNPKIFEKTVAGSTDYDGALESLVRNGTDVEDIAEALAVGDIRDAADLMRPVYDGTAGADGYASLEVRPTLAHDTEAAVQEARRLFAAVDRPNVMIKLPATPEGILAVRRLISEGINVNVTLVFSPEVYRQVRDAYMGGLEVLDREGGDVGAVASVASFFLTRVDTAVDALLEARIRQGDETAHRLLGKAAISWARLAYRDFRDGFGGERFAPLRAKGARVQRPLWARTGTRNPAYSDLMYVESVVGEETVSNLSPATLTAFLDHGRVEQTLQRAVIEAEETRSALANAGVDMELVNHKLLEEGIKAFVDSYHRLLANIREKAKRLTTGGPVHPGATLGSLSPDVETAVAELAEKDIVARIWRRDYTVWKPDPTEIADRLGWLDVTEPLGDRLPDLESFAREVMEAGYRHVVLLGMGGSSLGPEVLRQTLGSSPGYPELIVLDSTLPDWVGSVSQAIDPARALFLVSSKSGGTAETISFYRHFRRLVEGALMKGEPGHNFVAITDAGTSLEGLAREEGFRRVYLNPSDIGGRYSVLSYFGLVPAALMGLDLTSLLDRADRMREGCASCVPVRDNHGAWLGSVMGANALNGRDKLTLVTSPSVSSFGLWAEQLLAESTGKEGRGIVPIAGEPLLPAAAYGDDRLFVYLRLEGDDNSHTDPWMGAIRSSGHPVVRLDLRDKYDLGGEFFRWEYATAVAGSILGIHPFDQPDVQGAKDMTGRVLQEHQATDRLPQAQPGTALEPAGSLKAKLSRAAPGDYLAVVAYVLQTPVVDEALGELRRVVMERYRVATTLGYGPRYLHSTGQLHKGGPPTGLYLVLTSDHGIDLPIPGESHGFGVLADAQALGDLRALRSSGRRVARVHLGSNVQEGISQLSRELAK